jgi:hypothetical protein
VVLENVIGDLGNLMPPKEYVVIIQALLMSSQGRDSSLNEDPSVIGKIDQCLRWVWITSRVRLEGILTPK